jgi:hypothetical protein
VPHPCKPQRLIGGQQSQLLAMFGGYPWLKESRKCCGVGLTRNLDGRGKWQYFQFLMTKVKEGRKEGRKNYIVETCSLIVQRTNKESIFNETI